MSPLFKIKLLWILTTPTSEDHVLHCLEVIHYLWPLRGTTGSKSRSMESVSDSEKSQRMCSKHTKNKWTRGCSLHPGVANDFLRQVVPLLRVQSTHCRPGCAFPAVQFPPWLPGEPGCTPGNKGPGAEISIAVADPAMASLCLCGKLLDKTPLPWPFLSATACVTQLLPSKSMCEVLGWGRKS